MKLIGLTGGIATGKSTVSTLFRSHGLPVVDADEIAKAVVQKGVLSMGGRLTRMRAHANDPFAISANTQGRWGYRRVVKTFGTDILQPDGDNHPVRHNAFPLARFPPMTHLNLTQTSCFRIEQAEIDRKKLGKLIFENPDLRQQLNAATHPIVTLELARQIFMHWLLFRFVVVRRTRLAIGCADPVAH